MLRLEISHFNSGEPSRWIYQAEQFFEHHQTPQLQQVRIASFHLKGEAFQWYKSITSTTALTDWVEFQSFDGSIWYN
jgi:hypothetical protein